MPQSVDVKRLKEEIRRRIWSRMLAEGVALPPFPIEGRIPNFRGAELAARRLVESEPFQKADVVFCNPDSPQRPVREAVLRSGKLLIMATPKLRNGFVIIDPRTVAGSKTYEASTIRGAFKYGRLVLLEVPHVDLKVAGSVAVSPEGGRVGKGGGFSDLEFGILRRIGAVDERTPVVTTIHDVQLVEHVPMERHDVPVDVIYTPSRVIAVSRRYARPEGIYWEEVDEEKMREIPVLKALREGQAKEK